jgi:hypothetical protein
MFLDGVGEVAVLLAVSVHSVECKKNDFWAETALIAVKMEVNVFVLEGVLRGIGFFEP